MKVAIVTLGCRTNKADSSLLADRLASRGIQIVADPSKADVVLINTCTVTLRADRDARKITRKIKKSNPDARILWFGCLPKAHSDEVLKTLVPGEVAKVIPGFDPNGILSELLAGGSGKHTGMERLEQFVLERQTGRSRAFVKIQEGCDRQCTYCIVPRARGKSRSLPYDEVFMRIRQAIKAGFLEVVLCGTHIEDYNYGGRNLIWLMNRIEEEFESFGVRFRLSSLEPSDNLVELAKLLKPPLWCRHLHIAIQHLDDRVLKAMARPYRWQAAARQIEQIKSQNSEICVGADIIVGFPAEDKEAFMHNVARLESLPVDYLHVFSYSPRPGTRASQMKPAASQSEVKEWTRKLVALSKEKRYRFFQSLLGRRATMIKLDGSNSQIGLTDNYAHSIVQDENLSDGTIYWVEYVQLEDDKPKVTVVGTVSEERR